MPPKATIQAFRDWSKLLATHLSKPIESVHVKRVSSLWAGYGSVSELIVTFKGSKQAQQRLIVKEVQPPRDSGVGHERKVQSYACESAFYSSVAEQLIEVGLAVPNPAFLESHPPGSFTFVLSDLTEGYPNSAAGSLTEREVLAALDFLAALHAYFYGKPLPGGLQKQGCYWYLDTRQDELAQTNRSRWADVLKAAELVDARLKGIDKDGANSIAKHLTVVHGDAKPDNLLFSKPDAHGSVCCAAYDFQYCGAGLGVKDVVYLFTSGVDASVLQSHAERYLQYYHRQLTTAMAKFGTGSVKEYPYEAMQEHFGYALVDYVRFMAGWGTWGAGCNWALAKCREVLPLLR